MQRFYRSLSLTALLLLVAPLASAHRVNLFAYAEGGMVFSESYFPDGRPVAGGKVLVFDSTGSKLLEGVTDKGGLFNFKMPKLDDLRIVIDATLGHKNEFTLKRSELEEGR
jgi:nickel transport protein